MPAVSASQRPAISNVSSRTRKPPGPLSVSSPSMEITIRPSASQSTLGGPLSFAPEFGRLDHLVQPGFPRVRRSDDVNPPRDEAGNDQVAPGALPVATGAGVPAEVV